MHREKIFAAIRDRLVGVALPAPHKRLAWTARGARLAEAFEAAWLEASDGVFKLADKLPALLHPADPWRLIDEHRDLTRGQPGELLDGEPAKGSLEWSPVVGAALALEVEAQLRSAVPRMGRRYVAQAEGGGGAVTVGMLVTSHPFDRIVARLLCAPGVVQLTRVASSNTGRRGGGRGEGGRDSEALGDASEDFRDGLRMVSFEWQGERDPALWNWVRVVEPADARKEEVAMAVFDRLDGENHTELAYGLTGSSPFFQIPPRWAQDLAGAREHAPRRAGAALEPADGLEAAEQRSGLALADSVLGDEAAEAQARRRREGQREEGAASTTPGLSRLAELLERSAAQLTLVLARLGPWHLYGLTGPALRWIARHREALISAPESTLQRWAPIIEEQQALLFDATGEISEVLDATAHLEPISSSAQAQPARAVVQAYAIAMGESHLVESAAAQLAVARRCKAELPLRMLELSLRESRATAREAGAASSALVDASKGASTSEARAPGTEAAGASASGAAAAGATGSRLASQPGMEWSALAQREASVTGRPIDPHAVSALAVAAAESAHRHRISALDDRLAALQLQVGRASEGVVATLANLFHGELRRLPGTLLRVQRAARQTVASMDARTQAWMEEHAGAAARGGEAESRRFSEALVEERRKNLAQARRELAELAEREDLQRLFQHAVDTIRDAATYTLVFEAALLIGVAVVGTFAGAAVGGLVRGAMLADVAVDSAAFYRGAMLARGLGSAASLGTDAAVNALGQTALGGGEESTARAFAVNLLSSAAVIAALRPLQGAARDWAVLDDNAQKLWTVAGGKRVLAQGAVLGAEMIAGAAIGYAVERAVPRARAGKPAGEEEATSWLIQGAAMGAGRFVSGRLQGLQERLGAMAEGAVHLRKRAAAQAALAARVEETGDSAVALRLLDEHTQLLRDEAALLAGRPGAGALASGVDAQQLATLRAGNAAALVETESSAVSALRLHFAGLEPLSATGTMWAGTRSQIEAALAAAGPTARNVHHDALRRRWTAELAGKRIELAEVASGGAAAREAGHAEPPARAPRGEAPHRQEPAPAHEEASQRATGEMAAVDPHAAELARIRNGPPGKIRDEGELSNGDVAMSMNAQMRAISPEDVQALIGRFPAAQQAEARYVLARASQFGNMESWNALRLAIEPNLGRGEALYLPGSGSLADNLAYTDLKHSYDQVPGVAARLETTREIRRGTFLILDDVVLHKLRTEPELAKEVADHDCRLFEPRGFNAGVNLYNSPSPEAVAGRTNEILQRALALTADGRLSFQQAVDAALSAGTLTTLVGINPKLPYLLKEVDAVERPELSNAALSQQLNGKAGITEQELAAQLSQLSPEHQRYARELMARQSEIFSSRRFASELADQHQKLVARAGERGIAADHVYFLIPKSAKSYGMLAMAHRQATATPVDRYLNGLGDVKARKLGQDTAIVIFDDVAGSGESLRVAALSLGQIGYSGPVFVSPMISTEVAKASFDAPVGGVSAIFPNVMFEPRSMSRALRESFFFDSLGPADQREVKRVAGNKGYGGNGLSTAFPYMAPDNNNALFGDLIAKFFMMNRNRAAAKSPLHEVLDSEKDGWQ